MRISYWSSDVCSSDLIGRTENRKPGFKLEFGQTRLGCGRDIRQLGVPLRAGNGQCAQCACLKVRNGRRWRRDEHIDAACQQVLHGGRSEERRVGKEWVSTGKTGWSRDN